jgi:hypothetical protein
MCREVHVEDAAQTWDAAADRSSWAISLGNARTAARCALAEQLADDMAQGVREIVHDNDPSSLPAELLAAAGMPLPQALPEQPTPVSIAAQPQPAAALAQVGGAPDPFAS